MRRPPGKRTNELLAREADALYVHAAGRSTLRVSKRRMLLVVGAVVSAVVTAGFALGFLLHGVGHG